MIRTSRLLASAALLATLCGPLLAQQSIPPAQQNVPAAPAEQTPAAPAPATELVFPKPDPANFTAVTPSKETVNAFLQVNWGYDEKRTWQVQAILKTPLEGYSKVVVFVGEKGSGTQKPQGMQFIVLPGGKHIISGDEILPFGAYPFADHRELLKLLADGPYRGSASKDLELVEFSDFQCPHCKEAQATTDKLLVDFPKARIVYQNYPLTTIHPSALLAAEYGVCVAKLSSSSAFFIYANAVFDGQDGLASSDGTTLTLNSAVTKAGLDPAKVSACAKTAVTQSNVQASIKLAQDLGINQTPTLLINGRQIPLGGMAYETLKQIVAFQAKLDGVATK